MAEDEITDLKVALGNQLLIIKRLYTELEEERQASASGADEALSMILRLQKEKAEEKMEHHQYKKMVEAKMHHAQKSISMLQQLLFQKEFENESLKHRLQAYERQLSIVHDADAFSKSTASLEKASLRRSSIRRHISMPSVLHNMCPEKEITGEFVNVGDFNYFSEQAKACPYLPSIRRKEVSVISSESLQTDVQQLKRRIREVEDDIRILKQEDVTKELKLLREIQERLDTVQSHIRSLISNKPSPRDAAIFASLTEAMLSFSI